MVETAKWIASSSALIITVQYALIYSAVKAVQSEYGGFVVKWRSDTISIYTASASNTAIYVSLDFMQQ